MGKNLKMITPTRSLALKKQMKPREEFSSKSVSNYTQNHL